MPSTAWIGITLAAATALTYAYVGRLVLRRGGEGTAAPLRAFALWWAGIAIFTAIGVVRDALGLLDLLDLDIVETSTHLSIMPLVLGLWGLFYYLGYIFVGERRLFWPSIALYVVVYAIVVHTVVLLEPASIVTRTWDVQIEYASQIEPWMNLVLLVLLLVPILVAVLGYATLLFRLERGEQRLRVAVVSLAFLVWFGGSLLATLLGLAELEWWGLAGRVLALGSAALVAFAYKPPQRLRAAWSGTSLEADELG